MTPLNTDLNTYLANLLETDSGVDPSYRHAPKRVTPGEPIETPGALFKWYGLHAGDKPIPGEITRLARAYLTANPLEARGLGFVVLHRCGNDFYFLIVCTWRGSNEIWQTVFYKDGDAMPDFALWPRDGAHKPTFCVWELVPVWQEQQAWERFLSSPRDEAAAQAWLDTRFAGPA
ncbi:MAG TPA: hypothetical protein VF173_05050 [Thermoanaerobaculia bacterium]|nr:hypothetical protein [Thermoanaerobaculia bacterium]